MVITISTNELPHLTFFADSSSRDRDFMVAGGFAVAGHRIAEIEQHISDLRNTHGVREFHWSDYKGGAKKAAYEALVDYAFSLIEKQNAALHIIIAKFKGYAHKAKTGENRDTSINRMYYQLSLHRLARFYGSRRAIHIRLDAGNDSADMCGMRNQLCAHAYKHLGARPNCVRSIEPVCSSKVGIVQMADVIVGAAAAKRNNVQHSSAKGPLADFVLERSGLQSWHNDTHRDARFLTVWNHKGNNGPS